MAISQLLRVSDVSSYLMVSARRHATISCANQYQDLPLRFILCLGMRLEEECMHERL